MKPIVRRIATSRALWVIAALVLIYTLIGYLLVPYLVERSVPRYVEDNLGLPATIGKVRVNPFLFKVEADDFRLGADAGQPVAAFNRVFIDLELVSVLRWAWTFADVQLDGLQVNGRIERNGRFNLGELAERWSKAHPSEPGQKPPRTIVRHLALHGASVSFTDLSQPKPASAKSDAIDLEVDELATLPDSEGRYAFSARLPGGGALSWQGDISLQPIASKGEWHIKGLRLATVWQFFRDELNLVEPRGNLAVAGRYDFSYDNGTTRLELQGVHAQVGTLSVMREGEKRPMLALETIEATDARYDLAKHELVVPRLKLANGTLSAIASEQGTLDWQTLLKEKPHAKDAQKKSAPSPFHARAEAITVENVGLRYTDRTRAAPLDYAAGLHGSVRLDIASAADAAQITGSNLRLALTNA
ncbi:MAG TPA: DUF748 domain-containing protein, partial [Burkholderiales bacterium]|nr:DUF748 domain-containing protein [Burkholderiales bacterium]